jgi:hypothetical protein
VLCRRYLLQVTPRNLCPIVSLALSATEKLPKWQGGLYYSVTEGGLELPKSTATGIVGAYGGLVYLSTVLGGWIADRLLGMERTVLYGGVVVMCGLLVLSSAR